MKALTCALLVLVALSAAAQKPPMKFGQIPMEDLEMKVYPNDSSAEAVVLGDFGESTLSYSQSEGSFKLRFERIRRVKILTAEGLGHADFEIPLYHSKGGDYEKLGTIKATTYNLVNGKIVGTDVEKANIFREERDENIDIVKVTFPGAAVGSVLELSYAINSDFWFNFQDWDFQSTIPVRLSEYRAYIPEYFNYDKYMQGYITLNVAETKPVQRSINLTFREVTNTATQLQMQKVDYTENTHRWVAQNVPAFKIEPFMYGHRDYISRMNFELAFIKWPNEPIRQVMGSWADINKQYFQEYNAEIIGNNFLKSVAEQVAQGATTAEQRISAACLYVKRNFQWDGTNRKFAGKQLSKVVAEKKGSSAELNLLAASILEKLGIVVRPVLTATRDFGHIREAIPVSSQFNYVLFVADLGEKSVLIDVTEDLLPSGMIPGRCLNSRGFVTGMDGFTWINLDTKVKSKTNSLLELTIEDARLSGTITRDHSGYNAYEQRKKYFGSGEETFFKEFTGTHAWDVRKRQVENADSLDNNFKENYELSINENITAAGNVLYVEPFVIGSLKANPFKTETRQYPVDFGAPSDDLVQCKLKIPADYEVDELPASKMIALPGNAARYFFSINQSGNMLSITSMLSINKGLFGQDEYPALREFFNQVVAKQSEQIVLKKK